MGQTNPYAIACRAAAGAFGVAFALLLLSACGGAEPKDQQAPKKVPLVSVETVMQGELVRSIDLTAEVVPVEAIRISSTVDGPIGFCPWREGDRVEAGQKLIEIDREVYRAEVKAAEAALAIAQAKLDDLKAGSRPEEIDKARQAVREAEQSAEFEQADMKRVVQLVEKGILASEELERARVKLVAAEAKLKSARRQLEMLEEGFRPTEIAVQEAVVKQAAAQLKLAQARLNECVITAPFTGIITRVYVRKGDMAFMPKAATAAPLLEMADLSSLVVRCAVPEANASKVAPGMKGQVRLDALPGKTLPASVTRVFPQLDPRMRTRTIELTTKDNGALAPGMFGRVRLILESVPDAVTVPVHAVIVSPTGARMAFVAADGKAVQRKVQTGIEEGGRIQILSGLKPGEKVIVSGQERLKDGAEIRLPVPAKESQPKGTPAEALGPKNPNKAEKSSR